MIQKHLLLCICFLALVSCATYQENLDNIDTTNLAQLENIRVAPRPRLSNNSELSGLRITSLEDSAMGLGAQGGLAWAAAKLNAQMNQDRRYLDTIYNFNGMVLSHGVLPPVLVEANNSLNLDDPDTVRVADKTYRIVAQARFATTPPNWREYLLLPYDKPALPNRTLLPRSSEEQQIWRRSIRLGWEKGIQQAYNIFQQNLGRLKRDFRGMMIYRKLLQQNMINAPFVARTELGVTGDGTDMRINDQVLRIVEHPKLQTNTKHWQAVVVKRYE